MKIIILCLIFTQAYSACEFNQTIPSMPDTQYVECIGSAPDKDQTLLSLSNGNQLDLVSHFMLKKISGELYPEMLKILPGLQVIWMNDNNFKTIPKDFFKPCAENLEWLIIIDNNLESIDADAFLNLKSLTYLVLIKNFNLKGFSVESLKNSKRLEVLTIPAETFNKLEVAKLKSYFPNLKTVGVFEGEKDLVKDKVKELESHYHIVFETTTGLVLF